MKCYIGWPECTFLKFLAAFLVGVVKKVGRGYRVYTGGSEPGFRSTRKYTLMVQGDGVRAKKVHGCVFLSGAREMSALINWLMVSGRAGCIYSLYVISTWNGKCYKNWG